MMKSIKILISLLIIQLFIINGSTLLAQDTKPTDSKKFKIVLEKKENKIDMSCSEGCAWKELSFTLSNYEKQAIDEYGMTKAESASNNKDSKLADFLFTLNIVEQGLELNGIEGTNWTKLNFTIVENQKILINEYGMETKTSDN